MDNKLYDMIFKRKSFHLFRDIGNEHICDSEIDDIYKEFDRLKPLVDDIDVKIRIVKESTTCKRGQEYCILFYSEKKDNYLQNIGYLGEQLDLYLVSKNIGTLWFGIGKVEKKELDGLEFVIMIAISKVDSSLKFRKDMYKSKRKELCISEIWSGDSYLDIADIVRFAPSACNSQPWYVESSSNELKIYRRIGRRGIMPKNMVIYYNQIDMGIFLCFLDLCLDKNKIGYERIMHVEEDHESKCNVTATYHI